MSTSRVRVIDGEQPLLFIAPHGSGDDKHTDTITELCAEMSNGSAVINQGWRRAPHVDRENNKANCNNIQHCLDDMVRQEFLDPILSIVERLEARHGFCHIYNLHGVGNYIRRKANDPALDVAVGYGAGSPPSFSCEPRLKNALFMLLEQQQVIAYEGLSTGFFAGSTRDNLNQLFRVWYPSAAVQSMQLEFVRTLRNNPVEISTVLAKAASQLIEMDDVALEQFAAPTKGI